jgi:nitric oxide synthase oxygenase domain/subunit
MMQLTKLDLGFWRVGLSVSKKTHVGRVMLKMIDDRGWTMVEETMVEMDDKSDQKRADWLPTLPLAMSVQADDDRTLSSENPASADLSQNDWSDAWAERIVS